MNITRNTSLGEKRITIFLALDSLMISMGNLGGVTNLICAGGRRAGKERHFLA